MKGVSNWEAAFTFCSSPVENKRKEVPALTHRRKDQQEHPSTEFSQEVTPWFFQSRTAEPFFDVLQQSSDAGTHLPPFPRSLQNDRWLFTLELCTSNPLQQRRHTSKAKEEKFLVRKQARERPSAMSQTTACVHFKKENCASLFSARSGPYPSFCANESRNITVSIGGGCGNVV